MKKTSIFAFLMIALGFAAKAQTIRLDIPQLYDGMDSITVHYNPFGSGGNAHDTVFQTTTGPLVLYIYGVDSTTGAGGGNNYADGSWTSIEAIPACYLTRIADTDWVMTMPTMRPFLNFKGGAVLPGGVPKNTYITGLNFIVHDTGASIIQGATQYAPVSESYALIGNGYPLSTGPVTNVPGSIFLADANENVAIYYHPQQDTFRFGTTLSNGDSLFKSYTDSTLYAWVWAHGSNGVDYNIYTSTWSSVPTTPGNTLGQIDSNNYVFDVHSLRADFMNAGLPSGVNIDSLGFIPRNAGGDVQTANLWIPLIPSHVSVANVNANTAKASVYPNPATDAIFVSYSFAQQANATLTITNLMGQTVMTQDLGNRQAGNIYLSIANIPAGVYLVTVNNGTSSTVQRVVKQ
jgi:hypothetical protein